MKEGHATTRESNSVTNAERDRRNECKQQLLNGFLSPIEYHNAVSLMIGRDDYNLGTVSDISENLSDDSNESVD